MKNITIDRKEYSLDFEKAIKDGCLKPHPSRSSGQTYHYQAEDSGTYYLLAYLGNSNVALVNLVTGDRWANPCRIVDRWRVTETEWDQIIGHHRPERFTLVESHTYEQLSKILKRA